MSYKEDDHRHITCTREVFTFTALPNKLNINNKMTNCFDCKKLNLEPLKLKYYTPTQTFRDKNQRDRSKQTSHCCGPVTHSMCSL